MLGNPTETCQKFSRFPSVGGLPGSWTRVWNDDTHISYASQTPKKLSSSFSIICFSGGVGRHDQCLAAAALVTASSDARGPAPPTPSVTPDVFVPSGSHYTSNVIMVKNYEQNRFKKKGLMKSAEQCIEENVARFEEEVCVWFIWLNRRWKLRKVYGYVHIKEKTGQE